MGKKKELEAPEYEKIVDLDKAEELLAKYKDDLHRKTKQLGQAKTNKKEQNSSFNEVIKETGEEIDHICGVIDGLNDCKRRINSGAKKLRSV